MSKGIVAFVPQLGKPLDMIVATEILHRAEERLVVAQAIGRGVARECISVTPWGEQDCYHHIGFDLAKIGRRRERAAAQQDINDVSMTLSGVTGVAQYDELDPAIIFGIGHYENGQVGMRAEVTWPQADDEKIAQVATRAMHQVARNLGSARGMSKEFFNGVYASVSRRNGVTLETNPAGSCSFETDGMDYDATEEVFTLVSHNLYSMEQGLICLAGAVAIAHADSLA